MKLRRIEGSARGQRIKVEVGDLTLVAGPTGSYKTTTLNLIAFAVDGHVRGRGRVVKRLGDVFEEMGGGDGEVGAILHFEEAGSNGLHFLRRRITPKIAEGGARTLSQSVDESGLNDNIADRIGHIGNLDVRALLDDSAPNRLRAMLRMVQPFDDGSRDAAWCRARFAEITGAEPSDWVVRPETFAALQATAEAARQAVYEHRRTRDAAQRAVDGLAQRAAEPPIMPGGVEELGRRLTMLHDEIGQIERALGDSAIQHRRSLMERLKKLDHQRAIDIVRGDVEAAAVRLQEAVASLDAIQPPTPPDASRIAITKSAESDAEAAHETARAEAAAAVARRDAMRAAINCLGESCPTCHQPVAPEHVDALREQLDRLEAEAARAEAARTRAAKASESIRGIVAEAHAMAQTAQIKHAEAVGLYRARRAELEARIQRERMVQAALAKELGEVEAAIGERERLQAELAALAPADTSTLEIHLQGAKSRRSELQRARDMAVAQREAREAMAAAVAQRDAATAAIEPAKRARDGWAQVRAEYTRKMIEPFTEACRAALPAGWEIEFDLETAAFSVARPGRPVVDLLSLSEGERVLAINACAVGVARTAGNPWRLAVVDHAEALSNWPTSGAPDGLFARFMEGLRRAVDTGLIDQAIVACSRLPTTAETQFCDVVHLTEPAPTSAGTVLPHFPRVGGNAGGAMESFIAQLPERSQRFIEMVRERRSVSIDEVMVELGIERNLGKVVGGIVGSINKWARSAGVTPPIESAMVDSTRTYRWVGGGE